jgi:LemA protein
LKEMNSSLMLWFGFAVLLCWAVGAYNRLVRLRSQGNVSFAILAGLLSQLVPMAKQCVWDSGSVGAAADQFQASLKVSRSQPLNGATTSALRTAFETLSSCWSRVCQTAPGTVQTDAVDSMRSQWEHISAQIEMARSDFNHAVAGYNAAISQFPAVLLARVFGFRPAQPM